MDSHPCLVPHPHLIPLPADPVAPHLLPPGRRSTGETGVGRGGLPRRRWCRGRCPAGDRAGPPPKPEPSSSSSSSLRHFLSLCRSGPSGTFSGFAAVLRRVGRCSAFIASASHRLPATRVRPISSFASGLRCDATIRTASTRFRAMKSGDTPPSPAPLGGPRIHRLARRLRPRLTPQVARHVVHVIRLQQHGPRPRGRPRLDVAQRVADHPALAEVQVQVRRRPQQHARPRLAVVVLHLVPADLALGVVRAEIKPVDPRAVGPLGHQRLDAGVHGVNVLLGVLAPGHAALVRHHHDAVAQPAQRRRPPARPPGSAAPPRGRPGPRRCG